MRRSALATRFFLVLFSTVAATVAACSGDEFVPIAAAAGAGGNDASGAAGSGHVSAGTSGAAGVAGEGGAAGAAGGGGAGAPNGGAAGKAGSAGGCANDDACLAVAGPCRGGKCVDGECVFANDDTRLPPDVPNDCLEPTCDGGTPGTAVDLDDPPDVDAACSQGVCDANGKPGTKPANDGAVCDDGRFCDKGFCVGCSDGKPCPTYGATDCRIAKGCQGGLCQVERNPKGVADENGNDCLAKVCLDDGSVGTSFEKKGKACTDGSTLVGLCNDEGECVAKLPSSP